MSDSNNAAAAETSEATATSEIVGGPEAPAWADETGEFADPAGVADATAAAEYSNDFEATTEDPPAAMMSDDFEVSMEASPAAGLAAKPGVSQAIVEEPLAEEPSNEASATFSAEEPASAPPNPVEDKPTDPTPALDAAAAKQLPLAGNGLESNDVASPAPDEPARPLSTKSHQTYGSATFEEEEDPLAESEREATEAAPSKLEETGGGREVDAERSRAAPQAQPDTQVSHAETEPERRLDAAAAEGEVGNLAEPQDRHAGAQPERSTGEAAGQEAGGLGEGQGPAPPQEGRGEAEPERSTNETVAVESRSVDEPRSPAGGGAVEPDISRNDRGAGEAEPEQGLDDAAVDEVDKLVAEAEDMLTNGATDPSAEPEQHRRLAPEELQEVLPDPRDPDSVLGSPSEANARTAPADSSNRKRLSVTRDSPSKVGDYKDLKARTQLESTTRDGVLKRTTFMASVSSYKTTPAYSMGSRSNNAWLRSNVTPAPGSYNLPDGERSKFRGAPRFSFGATNRFGMGQSPLKIQPGPGQYNPRDPSVVEAKVGFGTSSRGHSLPASTNPGPGAYETHSSLTGGLMFTARGRMPTSYLRTRSLPGPGAYNPTTHSVFRGSPKCGFGTSSRGQFATLREGPGPGAYELQNYKCVGKDSAKFSATSRRRMHDLNSYMTPGPGTYNAHVTSFGYAGAPSLKQIDARR